jgi:transketolase
MATAKTIRFTSLDRVCINTIRFLSVDAVQKANSGHPGLPLGAAPMAYVLWTRFLRFNPADPEWYDRDRFILSAGHGSMLLYSLLHLTGYDLPLEQIERFRQWESTAPGHPERGVTPGVEVTTGPLGQGLANAVGMAAAEAHLAARYNRPGFPVVDHYTYALVSDGDLMEGVASEAASLAGEWKLGKLICLYDDNRMTLAGTTSIDFTEDRAARFRAYGWQTISVADGNDLAAIHAALVSARRVKDRPSLILVRTHLGFGSPHKQDTFEAHGSPLGPEEVEATKKKLRWPLQPPFLVPAEAGGYFRAVGARGAGLQAAWQAKFDAYEEKYSAPAEEFRAAMRGELPDGWDTGLPEFGPDAKPISTRAAGGKVLRQIAARVPAIAGGSADLDPSTYTRLDGLGDFGAGRKAPAGAQGLGGGGWGYAGRNFHFGVREHGMGSILNGMAAHGGILPFGATFLVFSDYMRPPIRLAALMGLRVIYVFTHDSIALGEDGPTHQPVEHLLALRAIPNLTVIRPADANETAAAWRVALENTAGPTALILSRQNLPILPVAEPAQIRLGVQAGGYVVGHALENAAPELVLAATGSEVHLVAEARHTLVNDGYSVMAVSLPCPSLFAAQPAAYREQVFPPGVPVLFVEAGRTLGWRAYVECDAQVIGIDRFGASAPGETVMREFGITLENVCTHATQILRRNREART